MHVLVTKLTCYNRYILQNNVYPVMINTEVYYLRSEELFFIIYTRLIRTLLS